MRFWPLQHTLATLSLIRRCRLPINPASTFSRRPRSLCHVIGQPRPCGFSPSNPMGAVQRVMTAKNLARLNTKGLKRRGVVGRCQRKTEVPSTADQPRQTASIGSASGCESCTAEFSFQRGVPLLASRTARPGRMAFHSAALLGFSSSFRRFTPPGGRLNRFRDHPTRLPFARFASSTVFVDLLIAPAFMF